MRDGEVRVSAPGRANLIGNPSDQYGGVTLACTVALRARVCVEPAAASALVAAGEETPIGDAADLMRRGDRFDLARGVLRHLGGVERPARIHFESEIPRQSGLAGSSALVVALLAALLAWRGERTTGAALAERARDVERRALDVACGYVDHYLCTLGGLRFLDFAGKTPEGASPPEPVARDEPLEAPLPFVLAVSGVRHSSDAVHRPIRERWLAGEVEVRRAYERVAAIGREGRAALLAGDWPRLGALLDENHAIQRDLGGSGPANEALIAAAREAGALGAKLAGAGGGGTILALWPDADVQPLERALRDAGAVQLLRPEPVEGVRREPPP